MKMMYKRYDRYTVVMREADCVDIERNGKK